MKNSSLFLPKGVVPAVPMDYVPASIRGGIRILNYYLKWGKAELINCITYQSGIDSYNFEKKPGNNRFPENFDRVKGFTSAIDPKLKTALGLCQQPCWYSMMLKPNQLIDFKLAMLVRQRPLIYITPVGKPIPFVVPLLASSEWGVLVLTVADQSPHEIEDGVESLRGQWK